MVELLGYRLFPVLNDDLSNSAASNHLINMLGYSIGSFVGGFAAASITRVNREPSAVIVGLAIFAGLIANFLSHWHPLWFILVSLIYVPLAWLGGKLAIRIFCNPNAK